LGVLEGLGRPPPPTLSSPDSLTARDVSEVVASTLPGGDQPGLLAALHPDTRSLLQHIALLLSERAALLVAVPMATFLNRMGQESATIAVTGSLYKLHPTLATRLEHHTRALASFPFTYRLCDDGSGKGAGLVAAIAHRLANQLAG